MIKNLPNYAKDYESIIATRIGKDHFFYGAYQLKEANEIAYEMREEGQDVCVFRVSDIKEEFIEQIEGTPFQWHTFSRWNKLNNENTFHLSAIEKEMIENHKRFLEMAF